MALRKPVILDGTNNELSVLLSGDYIDPAVLGSGTPSSSTYLRGDGVWATVAGGGGGSSSFITLTDAPTSYTGARGTAVRVNGAQNALEFYNPFEPVDAVDWLYTRYLAPGTTTINTTVWPFKTLGVVGLELAIATGQTILVSNSGIMNGVYVLGSTANPAAVPITRRADWSTGRVMNVGTKIRVRNMLRTVQLNLTLHVYDAATQVDTANNRLTGVDDGGSLGQAKWARYYIGEYQKDSGATAIPGLTVGNNYVVLYNSVSGTIEGILDGVTNDPITLTGPGVGHSFFICVGDYALAENQLTGEAEIAVISSDYAYSSADYPQYESVVPADPGPLSSPIYKTVGVVGTDSSFWTYRTWERSTAVTYDDKQGILIPVVLGSQSEANAGSVAIGNTSLAISESVSIGVKAFAQDGAVSIGQYSTSQGFGSVAIGYAAMAHVNSVGLGYYARALSSHSVAFAGTTSRWGYELVQGLGPSWAMGAKTHLLHMHTNGGVYGGTVIPGFEGGGEYHITLDAQGTWRFTGMLTAFDGDSKDSATWDVNVVVTRAKQFGEAGGSCTIASSFKKRTGSAGSAAWVISAVAVAAGTTDQIQLQVSGMNPANQCFASCDLVAHEMQMPVSLTGDLATVSAVADVTEVTPAASAILVGDTTPVVTVGTVRYSTAEKAEVMFNASGFWELVASRPGDALYSKVTALVFGKGANNATTEVDRSKYGNAVTFFGNAKITTANPPPGSTSSMLFSGGTDRVEVAQTTPGIFGINPESGQFWSLEMMVRSTGGGGIVASFATAANAGIEFSWGSGFLTWNLNDGNFYAPNFTNQVSALELAPIFDNQWVKVILIAEGFGNGITFRFMAQSDGGEVLDNQFLYVDNLSVLPSPTGTQPFCIGGSKYSSYGSFNGQIAGVRITQGLRGGLYGEANEWFYNRTPDTRFFDSWSFPVDYPPTEGRNGELVGTTINFNSPSAYTGGISQNNYPMRYAPAMVERSGALYVADSVWLPSSFYPQAAKNAQTRLKIADNWVDVDQLYGFSFVWQELTVGSPSTGDAISRVTGRWGLLGHMVVKGGGAPNIAGSLTAGMSETLNSNMGQEVWESWGATPSWSHACQADGFFFALTYNAATTTLSELKLRAATRQPDSLSDMGFTYALTGTVTAYRVSVGGWNSGPAGFISWIGTSTGKVVSNSSGLGVVELSEVSTQPVVAIKFAPHANSGRGAFYFMWKDGKVRRILSGSFAFDPTYAINLNTVGSISATDYADMEVMGSPDWSQKAVVVTESGRVFRATDGPDLKTWVMGSVPISGGGVWTKIVTGSYFGASDYPCYIFRFGASPGLFLLQGDNDLEFVLSNSVPVAFPALESGAVTRPKAVDFVPGFLVQSEVTGKWYGARIASATAIVNREWFGNLKDTSWIISDKSVTANDTYARNDRIHDLTLRRIN